jgi:hypothetical protein
VLRKQDGRDRHRHAVDLTLSEIVKRLAPQSDPDGLSEPHQHQLGPPGGSKGKVRARRQHTWSVFFANARERVAVLSDKLTKRDDVA